MNSRHQGFMTIWLGMLLVAATFFLVKASEYLDFKNQMTHGRDVAEQSLAVINQWATAMNYRCVIGDYAVPTINELEIDQVPLSKIDAMSISFSAPPNPTIEIKIDSLSKISRSSFLSVYEKMVNASSIPAVIRVDEVGSSINVTGVRSTSAVATSAYGARSNADAVTSSVILDGKAIYGADGC